MAFTKKEKEEMLSKYEHWLSENQGIFFAEFNKFTMKEMDALRVKVRETGGNIHVAKNTLLEMALKKANMKTTGDVEGTTMLAYIPADAPALAKIFSDASKAETFNLKWGYLDGKLIDASEIKALADLPPLPVMRAMLLGTLNAPASQLVRTINEPARSLAAVVKAYSEKEAAA